MNATSATVSVTAPSLPAGTYDAVKVEACPPGQSPICLSDSCASTSLASCTVGGLATGTVYTVKAQLLKANAPISEQGAALPATPLHP